MRAPCRLAAQAIEIEIDHGLGMSLELQVVAVGKPGGNQAEDQRVQPHRREPGIHAGWQQPAPDGVAYRLFRAVHATLLDDAYAPFHARHLADVFALVGDHVEHTLALRVGRGALEGADRARPERGQRILDALVERVIEDPGLNDAPALLMLARDLVAGDR